MPEQGSRRQQGASVGDQTEAWKNERQMEAISQLFSAKRARKGQPLLYNSQYRVNALKMLTSSDSIVTNRHKESREP